MIIINDLQTNIASFVLGSEEGPLLATTAKDFDNKLQGAPEKAAPSQSTSIAVSYMSNLKPKRAEGYLISFVMGMNFI